MMANLIFKRMAGGIKDFKYEGIRLKWGEDKDGNAMHYTPDFLVFENDGSMTLIETKGAFIRDRDIVRFKGARAEWDKVFKFEMWVYENKSWRQKY